MKGANQTVFRWGGEKYFEQTNPVDGNSEEDRLATHDLVKDKIKEARIGLLLNCIEILFIIKVQPSYH